MQNVNPFKKAARLDEIKEALEGKCSNFSYSDLDKWLEQSGLKESEFNEKLYEKGMTKKNFLELVHSEPPTNLEFKNKWDKKLLYILNTFKGFNYNENQILNSFSTPFSQYFCNEIKNDFVSLKNISDYILDIEKVVDNLAQHLNSQLTKMCSQSLISSFYHKKEEIGLAFPDYIYTYLNKNENKYKLLSSLPVLARNLVEITENYIIYIRELIERFINDYFDIKKILFNDDRLKLISIEVGQGDTHRNGRSVAILKFEKNKKIVYKPRSLFIDVGYNKFIEWLNKKPVVYKLKTIQSIDKNEYGWQQFVQSRDCQTYNEVERYYYRMGALIGILYILNSTDMHYENIIANGEFPEIVDLETIIANNIYQSSNDYFPLNINLNTILGSGVTNTGNLFTETIDTDISALTGIPKQKSKKIKTSTIKYSENGDPELAFSYFETREQQNLVKLNGKWMNPYEYNNYLEKGLSDCLSVIKNHKKYIVNTLIDDCFKEAHIRVVPRASQVYASFLKSSYHPQYLTNGKDKEFLFELLWNVCKQEPQMKKLVNSEISDLFNNDIPYFTTKTNSLSIYNSKNQNLGKLYSKTALEMIKDKLLIIDNKTISLQLKLLKLSLIDFKHKELTINEVEKLKSSGMSVHLNKEFSDLKIGEYIYKNAIFNLNNITWIGWFSNSSTNNFSLNNTNYTMYNGSVGIALFLLELGRYYDKKEYKEMSLNLAKFLVNEAFKKEKFLTVSAINGLGAIIYLSFYIFSRTNKKWFFNQGIKLIKKLNNYNKSNIITKDFMNGHAGIIHLLINIYIKFNINEAKMIAFSYADDLSIYIKNHTSSFIESLISDGIAHGISGYKIAFESVNNISNGNYTHIIKYLTKLESEEDYSNNIVNSTHLGYWCNGWLGKIYERVFRKKLNYSFFTNHNFDFYEKCKKEIPNMERICLCHGSFGNLNLLISLYNMDSQLITKESILEIRNNILNSKDISEKIDYQIKTNQFGLFIGLSGIGYTLLRTKDFTIPDIIHFNFPQEESDVSK